MEPKVCDSKQREKGCKIHVCGRCTHGVLASEVKKARKTSKYNERMAARAKGA